MRNKHKGGQEGQEGGCGEEWKKKTKEKLAKSNKKNLTKKTHLIASSLKEILERSEVRRSVASLRKPYWRSDRKL
ncbi:hypothetical protein E2C01_047429 [Portunus trituberculatus]|uniref:Uncharacterized protein n=1 Tax=Portunus trituberculatus TaxID=210409 RepID=A0A5B7G7W5_PORTR|nr:hypothetical protein [Portunus trituberculatus]